ncbi:MAG TPA: carboxypeptidase regulatory-like domain-containing protein [Gemmatimonadaceae bacterium]|nr:carboxypeptidase regulatory-like domain-containing protein [Gemmatimonadaceae bacterium]
MPCADLAAQTPSPARHSVLTGVVVDSVRGGYLRGATVGLLGPSRMTFTDSLGRFRIDSIPPGEYQVALFDPLLDTLSLGVVSPRTRFAAGDTVEMVLAVPSQLSIVTAKCGPARGAEEDRALFGQVLDAATEQPVAGAQVSLNWTDLTISERTGVRSEPRRRQAETDARGYYKICGLPPELAAEAFVQRGGDSTGKVVIEFGDALLGLATFLLPGSVVQNADAARDTIRVPSAGTATVSGTVVDGNGRPIPTAHVSITGGINAATTDSSGTFTLSGQPTGTHALVVRRLGYMPIEIAVNLTPLRNNVVAVQMQQYVPVLAAVVIEGNRLAALERVGFNQRKTRGTGRYLERDFIRNRNAHRISNLLEGIPGLRRPGDGFSGGGCVNYWVDGNFWRGSSPEDFIMPDEIEAIEVYSGSFTPAEFQTLTTRGNDRCSTVVIWTRWKLRL